MFGDLSLDVFERSMNFTRTHAALRFQVVWFSPDRYSVDRNTIHDWYFPVFGDFILFEVKQNFESAFHNSTIFRWTKVFIVEFFDGMYIRAIYRNSIEYILL